MERQRILVTGGAGFIGSHLVRRLLERDSLVTVVDDFTTGSGENLPSDPRVHLIEGSVCDPDPWREEAAKCGVVFHLSALISSQDSLRTPDEYLRTNVEGLLRVLEATAGRRARVVFASSSTVYGQQACPTLDESLMPEPLTPYALSKLTAEHVLRMYESIYDYSHVSLRLFNVYGPRQNPEHPYANVTCKFARAAALGLPIQLVGDGQQSRDFVYVTDVVDALVAAADSKVSGSVNIGTGESYSIQELVDLTRSHAETTIDVEHLPPWPNDIRRVVADVSRAAAVLGWHPTTQLAEGFSRTVEWFRSQSR